MERILKNESGNCVTADEVISLRLDTKNISEANLGDFVVVGGEFNPGVTPNLSIKNIEIISRCVNPIHNIKNLNNSGSPETVINQKKEKLLY